MIKLSENQLAKLVLYQAQISTILLEACLTSESQQEENPEPQECNGEEIQIDLYEEQAPWEQEETTHNMHLDAFCGKWTGKNKKQPYLHILKTVDGYMAVFGKPDKRKNSYPDLFNLFGEKEYAWFDVENERVYVSLGAENDTLILSPGGTYTRVVAQEKK